MNEATLTPSHERLGLCRECARAKEAVCIAC